MRTHAPKTVSLGELIAAAFDEAASYSADPREVSRLATGAVARLLRRTRGVTIVGPPSGTWTPQAVAC
jgi:hypothetical protein